jgi:DNA (cytosine-5)-methyltransferase 1
MIKEINLLTVFSGVGSPEMAAQRAYDKVNLIGACEWDKFARESFKANYDIEDKHFHKDIADMDGTQYKGKVDILHMSPPCQAFSIAGKREGMNDPRGRLTWEAFRILEEVQPEYFTLENVAGLLSDKNGDTIKDILRMINKLGYKATMNLVNTKDVGGNVPQNRLRLFIIGKRKY